MSSFSAGQEQSILKFISLGLRNQYKNQSSQFRDLVSEDNQLLPLYIAIINTDNKDLKQYAGLSLIQAKSLLTGQLSNQCKSCGVVQCVIGHLKRH